MLNQLRTLPLAVTIALGFGATAALSEDAPSADTVVATVDGTEITLGHMIVLRAGLPEQYAQIPANVLYKGILDQLIQQAILENSFEGEISKTGQLQLDNERRAIVSNQILRVISDNALTDEAINTAYEETYVNAAQVTEYKASHILVETEDEAKALVQELAGGAVFADLAREHSTGPSGPGGGELGWFTADMMVEPFSAAVVAMEPGAVSEPVQTQFGWHVITLQETRTQDRPELEEVRAQIEETLQQDAVTAYLDKLGETATVDRSAGDVLDPELLNQFDLLED